MGKLELAYSRWEGPDSDGDVEVAAGGSAFYVYAEDIDRVISFLVETKRPGMKLTRLQAEFQAENPVEVVELI